MWALVAERADPAEFRPRLSDDVEIKDFKLRWANDYAMVANPRDLIHYKLEPNQAALVRLMDGTRSMKEIAAEGLHDSGDLELSGLADLVQSLYVSNFFDQRFEDVIGMVERALHPVSEWRRKLREFGRTMHIESRNADRPVRWLYRHGLKAVFSLWVQPLFGALAILGFAAFISVERSRRFTLSGRSLVLGSLILIALNYFLIFVHELSHAMMLVRFGRKVRSAGFGIYFGSPSYFIDSSDGLMMERGQRIAQSFAGPYAETVIAGIAAIVVWRFPHAALSPTLYKFCVLNYLFIFLNLIPLLELDGYWILSDFIQVPDLRPRSLAFVRHDLWHKLRSQSRFSIQEVGLGVYGSLGVLFTILAFVFAFFLWREVFGGLVSGLWHLGYGGRITLALLALLIAGPAIRGAVKLIASLGRRIWSLVHRIRFRLERKWRVEAALLIEALPLFDDVPAEALDDLAGRVRLRSFATGEPVVRQGERADAFYVVRTGTLQVVEEDRESGNERALRVLGRGEAFGELGLVEAAPRLATVRALEPSELFQIDKGTFDRLLADMVLVPEFAPTLQAMADLRELRCYAHLEADELREVLRRGTWENRSPGERIVTQGEVGSAFFAISAGQVEVLENGVLVRVLGPGEYFGEIALLMDTSRTATVVARTPVRLFWLGREGFDDLVRESFRMATPNPMISPDRTLEH